MKMAHTNNERKVLIGFKCSPSLRLSLCEQADKLGVTLSSHVETIVSAQENELTNIKSLSEQVIRLKERIAFYENPILKELYEQFKGKTISYKDGQGNTINKPINTIQDVFTVIINSFKTIK